MYLEEVNEGSKEIQVEKKEEKQSRDNVTVKRRGGSKGEMREKNRKR